MENISRGKIIISNIKYPHPVWRYMLLFQSWSQFKYWIAIVIVSTYSIHQLIFFLSKESIPLPILIAGISMGSLVSVYMSLPVIFTISPNSEETIRLLISEIENLKYVQIKKEENKMTYRQHLPEILRWDESNISIHTKNDVITVCGAILILKIIIKKIK